MLEQCQLIELPTVPDPRGRLTYVEGGRHVPFPIRRVYYVYDVPGGESRGGHAHKTLHQLLIAVSGCFDVTVDDGARSASFTLNRAYFGLYVPPMVWRELHGFASGSVCLVLASAPFDENDYFREYEAFRSAAREGVR